MAVLILIALMTITGCNSVTISGTETVADEGALWELFGGMLILGGLYLFRAGRVSQKIDENDELPDSENRYYDDKERFSGWLGGDKAI